MLNRSARLRRVEFDECFKRGRRHHSPHLTVMVLPQGVFKAAVVVSKKVAKKAHDRNRIRRRLYAQLAANQPTSGWYVFVVKPTISGLSRRESQVVFQDEIARLRNPQ